MISSVWDALKEIEKINDSKDIKESNCPALYFHAIEKE